MQFSHNEYVRDIGSSTGFVATAQDIIPTNVALFPLLSQFANNFEQYKFNRLAFFYKSKTSSASNSSIASLGTVVYTIKYDPTLPPFTSKNEMQNYDGSQSCRTDMNLQIRCRLRNHWLYNKPGGQSRLTISAAGVTASDKRNEVLGTLTIATQGQGLDNIPIGELWVDYDVVLIKAKLYQTMGGSNRGAKYYTTNTGNNWIGKFAATPVATSLMVDDINVTFDGSTQFSFDAIDGAIIEVRMKYQGITASANGTTTTTLSGSAGTSHNFQLYNIAVSSSDAQPRVAADSLILSPTTCNWSTLAGFATFGIDAQCYDKTFAIKCRGSGRVILTHSAATIGLTYTNLVLEINVLDRPNMFPQQLTTSVANPSWFLP